MPVAGDLKLEGPVSRQVKMLLEENAALQVNRFLQTTATQSAVTVMVLCVQQRLHTCCWTVYWAASSQGLVECGVVHQPA